jgi:hypothetical protein
MWKGDIQVWAKSEGLALGTSADPVLASLATNTYRQSDHAFSVFAP